jgi:hypothetical protein
MSVSLAVVRGFATFVGRVLYVAWAVVVATLHGLSE